MGKAQPTLTTLAREPIYHSVVFLSRQTIADVRSVAGLLTLSMALSVSGCSKRQSSSPTAATPVSPAPSAASHLLGLVADSAFRPLAGVAVEVTDGPQAGLSAISAEDGAFEISGTSTGTLTLRTTKDGFMTTTQSGSWRPVTDHQLVTVIMEPLGASLGLEPGNYTISLTADRSTSRDGAACSGFPDAFLTRSYAATITPQSTHARSLFSVILQLNNPAPFVAAMGFGLGIAGNAVGFTIDGPAISEVLPDYTYLEISGSARPDVAATSTASGISVPFSGSFQYCVLKSAMDVHNNCFLTPVDQKIAYAQCLSSDARMLLSKR